MLDLDAIIPKTFTVTLDAKSYEVPTADGLPVKASLDALAIGALKGHEQVTAMLSFIGTYAKIPTDGLTLAQMGAIIEAMMRMPKDSAAVDPPRTAEGVPGTVLGATPCKLP